MKKSKIIILIVLIFVILGSVFFLTSQVKTKEISPEVKEIILKDNIDNQISVYDFMNKLRNDGKINFTDKNYIGMGKLIVSINGISGNGEKNWIYYVNGVEAQVGVSNYKIKSGDIVSWKYEKANY